MNLFSRDPWPHQTLGVEQVQKALANGTGSVCLTSPTGSGKTAMQIYLTLWGLRQNQRVLCVTNRILLTEQTRRVFKQDGVQVGVVSASMPHWQDEEAQVQIATIQTLMARRKSTNYWLDAQVVLVDEVHQCSSGESADLLNEYRSRGAQLCGITATPLGVSNVCDRLIVAAGTADLQSQGILVRASWFAPSELDTRRLTEGRVNMSFSETDARKTWGPLRANNQVRAKIVGNIIDHYRRLHPDLTHTLAFAPGVKESLWAANYCRHMGIESLHVDGDDFAVNGHLYDRRKDDTLFHESMERWRSGEIPILWNRFVLREGIDEPQIRCILLATPISSYRSFLQMVGRGLRTSPGKEACTVLDFGGNWWRHGSVNVNVDWQSVFACDDPDVLTKNRIAKVRETGESLGTACPNCGRVHKAKSRFVVCAYCGHQIELGKCSRPIIQADGELTLVNGEPITQWKIHQAKGDDQIWARLYHNGCRKGFTFAELYQQFSYLKAVEAGSKRWPNYRAAYYPPRTMKLMPRNKNDWWRKAHMVTDLY